ncbi:MAG: membrane protein insertion efficiency factor YidD [Magnetococcales bacterium]|nr:membrane protein insertion efficiency factor YidD [Magnetococcales bacterium]
MKLPSPHHSGLSRRLGLLLLLTLWPLQRLQGEENPLAYRPLHTPENHANQGLTPWLLFPLRLYSNTISRVDGDRCPSHPNCSRYAKEAMQSHGPLLGLWLTIDRLIHERNEIELAPRAMAEDGSPRTIDPLRSNDFWLREP